MLEKLKMLKVKRISFIKIKIAAKEADEVEYFLILCKESENYPFNDKLLEDVKSIIKVLSKIISSSKSI